MSNIVSNNFCIDNFFKNIKLNKQYINTLKNKIFGLNTKENLYFNDRSLISSFLSVTFIIHIIQKKTDTVLHITDSFGSLICSFNAHSVGFSGKAKRKARSNIIKKFAFLLTQSNNLSFIKNKPLALHLKNVGSIKLWLIKNLREKLFIETIRFFYVTPFNGCRAKKVRRKKIRKK